MKTLASDLPKTTKLLCVRAKRMIWGVGRSSMCFLLGFIMPCQVACWRFSALQWFKSGKMERHVRRGKQMQFPSLPSSVSLSTCASAANTQESPLRCWQGKDKERLNGKNFCKIKFFLNWFVVYYIAEWCLNKEICNKNSPI